uniref:Putative tick transposon n=1 Tax=Ixodes ricinus TaxID=34613 RepID=A0A6B0UZM1_IXORI
MSWNTHMLYLCSKLRVVSCMLYNTRVSIPVGVRLLMAHALAYSVIRYGVTVFGNCSGRLQTKVDTLLRGILTSVAYNTPLSTTLDIFKALQLPNLRSLYIQMVILRNFWNKDFKTPPLPTRSLRCTPRFNVPRCWTRYGKCTRDYYVPTLFNALPDSILDISSLKALKKELKSVDLNIT